MKMGKRGVSQPMAEQQSTHEHHDESSGNGEGHGGGHSMNREGRLSMLQTHHHQTLWIYSTLPLLGIWLHAYVR